MARPALQGLRVLDLGRYIAGPYCATLLADHGADVVRVEPPGGGEDRYVVPVAPGVEGGSFLQLARNKRSVCLDLATAPGRRVLDALLEWAEVLVVNLPPRPLRQLGLDYEHLSKRYPALIVTTVSAYGDTGPMADQPGFDGIGQVMSGAAFLSGTPGHPVRWAATYVDFGTALACAFGTMVALQERARTGRGQHVSGSLLRTALTFFNSNLIESHARGQDRVPSGNRGQQMAPSDIFAARDGHVLIQVLGQPQFVRLCRLIGREAWVDDPSLASDAARGLQADRICEAVAAWVAPLSCEEVLAALARARLPGARVLRPTEVLAHPQVQQGGHLQPLPLPSGQGDVPVVAPQVELSGTPAGHWRAAPSVGAHTREVLQELGLPPDVCEAVMQDQVRATRP